MIRGYLDGLCFLIALADCGSAPTFDACKPDESMKAIAAALPEKDHEAFGKAYAGFLLACGMGHLGDPGWQIAPHLLERSIT